MFGKCTALVSIAYVAWVLVHSLQSLAADNFHTIASPLPWFLFRHSLEWWYGESTHSNPQQASAHSGMNGYEMSEPPHVAYQGVVFSTLAEVAVKLTKPEILTQCQRLGPLGVALSGVIVLWTHIAHAK